MSCGSGKVRVNIATPFSRQQEDDVSCFLRVTRSQEEEEEATTKKMAGGGVAGGGGWWRKKNEGRRREARSCSSFFFVDWGLRKRTLPHYLTLSIAKCRGSVLQVESLRSHHTKMSFCVVRGCRRDEPSEDDATTTSSNNNNTTTKRSNDR